MKHAGSGKATPRIIVLTLLLAALLVARHCWSLIVSPVPFGYDAGIYRALFQWHALGWPPLMPVALPPWAQSHPLGVFAFTSILIKFGVPVDALIGWMWNVFAAVPAVLLTAAFWRTHGARTGVALLAVALLSTAQYEGFVAMYIKVFVALAWCVLAFASFERRSAWWVLPGMLVLATHLQVGLVLCLAVLSWCMQRFLAGKRSDAAFGAWTGVLTLVAGAAWYWQNFAFSVLPSAGKVVASVDGTAFLLGTIILAIALAAFLSMRRITVAAFLQATGTLLLFGALLLAAALIGRLGIHPAATPSGSFLSLSDYIRYSFPLLFLGGLGFALSVRRGHCGDVWQWALVWSATCVLAKFFFYLRFLLLLDFFLLPFAAIGLQQLWHGRHHAYRWVAVLFLCLQCIFLVQRLQMLRPEFSPEQLHAISVMQDTIPERATVLVLDNAIAPWALGLLPHVDLVAPGMFQSPSYARWERFFYGTPAERTAFFSLYRAPVFVFAGPAFRAFYPAEVQAAVLADPCMQPAAAEWWFTISCP